jgi:hypothetical protein
LLRIQPQHPDPAAVGFAQPFEAFHGRCLAGAIRADDPKNLAPLDCERDIVHRGVIPVPLL